MTATSASRAANPPASFSSDPYLRRPRSASAPLNRIHSPAATSPPYAFTSSELVEALRIGGHADR
jgi:hypothetical protein